MAVVNFDEDDIREDLRDLDDFNVIPRPQELLDLEKRSSGVKSKVFSDISGSVVSRKPLVAKATKLKEKSKERGQCRHKRTGSSKSKLPYKSNLNEKSIAKRYISEELDNKFESFLQSAKSSVFKSRSESSKTTGNEASDTDANKRQEIQRLKILDEPAVTAQQRFHVLEARDAAIRSKDSKLGDSKKQKVFGSCPDMCPEKERYSRIAKNCLSIMEMKTLFDQNAAARDANHCLMVKEYSRSSADQQEPLSHELRPISVLMFTMDYLICNIMDIPLDNITLADWYDFIWNRTRSIRKDITQQQLCNIQCVDIIEKCVRFHIHCAEALSEEETSIFDPKINNENLTKCLQTLKHMYHDLQSRGIQCPNEAEFRAYDILLSLTEGETLRLVKDIRKDLLKTLVLKTAFEAALAFKSHNYVRFFKIIEKANYLSSCILHRYILEARIRALQIIVRAYSTPHNATMYPTSSLVRDLKFENSSEACEFCKCHGLESNENYITIERRQFSRSASGLPMSRSFLLVASKRNISLGQVINNGQLPSNPLAWYEPHDSFNEKSMLKREYLNVAIKVDENKAEDKYLTKDVEMEDSATDNKSLQPIGEKVEFPSSFTAIASPQPKPKIKDANITELEKRRSYLLDKLKSLHDEKQKEIKVASETISQKIKSKTHHSHSKSVSKSHKSIMFSSDDSNSSSQQSHFVRPSVEITAKQNFLTTPVAHSNFSDNVFGQVESPFAKYSKLNAPKIVDNSSIIDVSEPLQKTSMNKSAASNSSVFFKLAVPVAKPVVHTKPSVTSKDFSFRTSPLVPPVGVKSAFSFKVAEPTKDLLPKSPLVKKNSAEFNFSSNLPLTVKAFEPSETSERISSFEKMESTSSKDVYAKDESIKKSQILEIEDIDSEIAIESSSEEEEEDYEKIREERREKELSEFGEVLFDELYTQCVEECSQSICEEVLSRAKCKQAQLEDELQMIRRNLMLKTIIKWKYFCERKRERRAFENSTLCSPWQPMLLNTPYATTGVVSPMLVYKKQCALTRLTAEKLKKRKEIIPGWEEFKSEEIWNLTKLKPHSSAYFGRSGIVTFFKLCLVFPAGSNNSDLIIFMDWICAKFMLKKTQDYEFECINTFVLNDGKSVISVRAIQLGPQMHSRYKEFLDGITAMILCLPQFSDIEDETIFFKDFTHLLDSDTLLYPYPLFVFHLPSQQDSTSLLSFLNEKLDAVYFSDMKFKYVAEVKYFIKNSKEMLGAVSWLIEKKISLPLLHLCNLRYFLEDSFTYAFNVLFCKNSLEEFNHLNQMPQQIIDFYNIVLEFRSDALHSDLLSRVCSSWPPKELLELHPGLKFVDMKTQQKCKEKMKLVLLPNFEGDFSCFDSVWEYVEDVSVLACKDKDMLHIRIRNALKNSLVPDWLLVINVCAQHLLYAQHSEFLNSSEDIHVYYTEEDLEAFECDNFWQAVLAKIRKSYLNIAMKRKQDSRLESPLKKKKNDIEEAPACNGMFLKEEHFFSNIFDVPDIFSCQRKNMFSNLENAVAKQNEQSDAFLQQLDETIISGNVLKDKQFRGFENGCFSEEVDLVNQEVPISPKFNTSFPKFSSHISQDSGSAFNFGIDWLDNTVSKKSFCDKSLFSIADKLSELKYNMQKSNILEDHFSQLLSKQM